MADKQFEAVKEVIKNPDGTTTERVVMKEVKETSKKKSSS